MIQGTERAFRIVELLGQDQVDPDFAVFEWTGEGWEQQREFGSREMAEGYILGRVEGYQVQRSIADEVYNLRQEVDAILLRLEREERK
jgi:hypothetical protein